MGEHKHGARAARAVASPVAPLVWKFGGTSVADHARLRAVAERMVAAQRSGRGVVAILSAMGSSTDELAEMAYKMSARPPLHLRSSFSTEEGTWIRREAAELEGTGSSDVAGVAHRYHETLYAARDVDIAAVAMALAERGVCLGSVLPDPAGLRFTAPGADTTEVIGALDAVGAPVKVDQQLGAVSVVSLGIARRPEVVVRTLAALRDAGIEPRLVTTTPGRVSVLVDSEVVDDAVRLLHTTFIPAAVGARARAAG
jgi:aspartokinase